MIRERQYIQSREGLNAFADELKAMQLPEHGVMIEVKLGKRTTAQNSALWLYLTMLADELNAAGLDMKKVLKPDVSIPWSKDSARQYLWGPIQKAITGKDSTTQLDINEVSEVFDVLHRHMAEKFGVMTLFPSKEQL